MKIKLLAVGQSPDHYSFDGDTITAHVGEVSESFDLSVLEHGDKFEGIEPEFLRLPGSQIIRAAHRDEHGEMHVTLAKTAGTGRWQESEWMDASEYDKDKTYILEVRDV